MRSCPLSLILLLSVSLTNGKPVLLATVGSYNSNVVDIVAIDPTKGNVSKLQLPPLPSVSDDDVCMKVNSERNLIHILVSNDLSELQPTFMSSAFLVDT